MTRQRCQTCGHLKAAISIAKGDLGDTRGKLARAQARHAHQIPRYLADVEDRKASLAYAKAELDRHQAECQVIVTEPRRGRLTTEEKRKIIDRYDAGDNVTDIADDYDITTSAVYYHLNGRPRRPHKADPAPADETTRDPQKQQGPRFKLPSFDEQPWADLALCAQTDPEAFFPEKGGSTRDAKRVCMACPVRTECLQYALDHQERFGIWGGLSERERRKLIKQRATTPAADEGAA